MEQKQLGTKWDVEENHIHEEELGLEFLSPWNPPVPVLEQLAEEGFEFNMTAEYEEGVWESYVAEGGDFTFGDSGEIEWDDEEEVDLEV